MYIIFSNYVKLNLIFLYKYWKSNFSSDALFFSKKYNLRFINNSILKILLLIPKKRTVVYYTKNVFKLFLTIYIYIYACEKNFLGMNMDLIEWIIYS